LPPSAGTHVSRGRRCGGEPPTDAGVDHRSTNENRAASETEAARESVSRTRVCALCTREPMTLPSTSRARSSDDRSGSMREGRGRVAPPSARDCSRLEDQTFRNLFQPSRGTRTTWRLREGLAETAGRTQQASLRTEERCSGIARRHLWRRGVSGKVLPCGISDATKKHPGARPGCGI